MNLIRWKNRPAQAAWPTGTPIVRLPREMERLFDRFLHQPLGWNTDDFLFAPLDEPFTKAVWNPVIDIAENDNEIVIRAEVPGIDASNIEVSVSGNELIISGEKKENKEQKGENSWYVERRFGQFRRILELPLNVNADRIAAECASGVLTVHVPRTEPVNRRQIEVKPSAGKPAETRPATPPVAQSAQSPRRIPVGAA